MLGVVGAPPAGRKEETVSMQRDGAHAGPQVGSATAQASVRAAGPSFGRGRQGGQG